MTENLEETTPEETEDPAEDPTPKRIKRGALMAFVIKHLGNNPRRGLTFQALAVRAESLGTTPGSVKNCLVRLEKQRKVIRENHRWFLANGVVPSKTKKKTKKKSTKKAQRKRVQGRFVKVREAAMFAKANAIVCAFPKPATTFVGAALTAEKDLEMARYLGQVLSLPEEQQSRILYLAKVLDFLPR